jgi:hypothetical protein
MPAYTGGFLAPVPFVYAAVKLRAARLWLIAAAYVAVWMVARVLAAAGSHFYFVLGAMGGALMLALAVGGTVHAFVLRDSLSRTSRRRSEVVAEQPLATPVPAPIDPRQTMCVEVRASLASLTSSVRAHAELFPSACKQLFDDTVARIEQVVSFVTNGGQADAELRSVHAIATDYLPTSVNTYIRLPREYAMTQRNSEGRTAGEELELGLRLLRDEVKEAADSLHRVDAVRLQEQNAFLQSKFGKSELDMP